MLSAILDAILDTNAKGWYDVIRLNLKERVL